MRNNYYMRVENGLNQNHGVGTMAHSLKSLKKDQKFYEEWLSKELDQSNGKETETTRQLKEICNKISNEISWKNRNK